MSKLSFIIISLLMATSILFAGCEGETRSFPPPPSSFDDGETTEQPSTSESTHLEPQKQRKSLIGGV